MTCQIWAGSSEWVLLRRVSDHTQWVITRSRWIYRKSPSAAGCAKTRAPRPAAIHAATSESVLAAITWRRSGGYRVPVGYLYA